MKIANWYENCKAILTFWFISYVDICNFHLRHSGNENLFWNIRMFWLDCGMDEKNSMKWSLAKPSTIHILIPIPMLTQSDSYFKPWFLCSQVRLLVWFLKCVIWFWVQFLRLLLMVHCNCNSGGGTALLMAHYDNGRDATLSMGATTMAKAVTVGMLHCWWAHSAKVNDILIETPYCQWHATTATAGDAPPCWCRVAIAMAGEMPCCQSVHATLAKAVAVGAHGVLQCRMKTRRMIAFLLIDNRWTNNNQPAMGVEK